MARGPTMMAADPAAAGDTGAAGDPGATDDTGTGDTGSDVTWLVSIGRTGDGAYVVHQGPTDDAEGGADDTDAGAGEGAEAAGGASQDQQVDSKGAALKAAMDIMDQADTSAGEDQFASGFGGDQSPMAGLKHPPAAG